MLQHSTLSINVMRVTTNTQQNMKTNIYLPRLLWQLSGCGIWLAVRIGKHWFLCSLIQLYSLNACLYLFFFIFLFLETVCFYISLAVLKHTLCRPDWPQGHRDTPASGFRVLGLMACATARLNARSFKHRAWLVWSPIQMCILLLKSHIPFPFTCCIQFFFLF